MRKLLGGALLAGVVAFPAAVLVLDAVASRTPGKPIRSSRVLGGKVVPARTLELGRRAYLARCAGCHGAAGDGKGPAAPGLAPPPRDFRLGAFKFAAVAAGSLPNDADLTRTIRRGLRGTAMPSWDDLPAAEVAAIVQFLKTFSPRWSSGTPGEPIVPGPDPWGRGGRAAAELRGMKVYHALAQCALCHPAYASRETVEAAGRELLGRPVSLREDASTPRPRESDYGVTLVPPDFRRDRLRSGPGLPDLYLTIASGIGGTAMPTWKGALPEADLWALAYYVRSLAAARQLLWPGAGGTAPAPAR